VSALLLWDLRGRVVLLWHRDSVGVLFQHIFAASCLVWSAASLRQPTAAVVPLYLLVTCTLLKVSFSDRSCVSGARLRAKAGHCCTAASWGC
jgi:hypothetical protein